MLTGHVGEFVGILGGLEGGAGVEENELAKVLESVASVVQALESDKIVEPILVSIKSCSTIPPITELIGFLGE